MSDANNNNNNCLEPYNTDGLLDCPPLSWGILGCGRVSHDFCQALKHVQTAQIVACATANHLERAQEFAKLHNINSSYGSYDELVKDPNVDIVYVGNLHNSRRQIGELVLNHNKHVLLEKPMAVRVSDARHLIDLAQSKNLFLLEGLWTVFFPAVRHAKQLADHQLLGDIVNISSDFNFNAADSESYPDSFVYNRKLGGGASLLTGPYPIAATMLFVGDKQLKAVKVVGSVDEPTGVDLQAAMALEFDNRTCATLSYGMLGESEEVTTVVGTKGRLTIQTPCHCPTKLSVNIKAQGRGKAARCKEFEYKLPADTPEIVAAGGFYYPNSAGFCYEAAAVARCIGNKQLSCDLFTWDDSIQCQQILQDAREQLNLKSADED